MWNAVGFWKGKHAQQFDFNYSVNKYQHFLRFLDTD